MAHVIVVGAGAIGSHVVTLAARMSLVDGLTIVDPQSYEPANLANQNIATADIGKSKAQAQLRRAKRVRHDLAVTAYALPVESLPLGRLRADVILACVDSRRARMTINQAAWRLGVPWINAGIDASGLARVQAFVPGAGQACLECAWDAADYALVEQSYPCAGASSVPPTASSAALASLAASLQVIECEKLLSGRRDDALIGRDVMLDTRHHRHFVTTFRRQPACRMPDHEGWQIRVSQFDPMSTTFAKLLAAVAPGHQSSSDLRVNVAGCTIATGAPCSECGTRAERLAFVRPAQRQLWRCLRCGGPCEPSGFDLRDDIAVAEARGLAQGSPLSAMGLTAGDVVTLTQGTTVMRMEVGGVE